MKEKIKKILNSKIFVFLLGGVLLSTVSVYAVTYFPSNQVTYDNSSSKLNSTNVQGAIDELYNECVNPPISADIVTSGDGLYEKNGRYIYRGANPKNYIRFNNELWRIISVEADGIIKILRNSVISGTIAWDTSGSINWDRPATLNTYLNGTYYNTLTDTAKNQIVSYTYDDVSVGTYKVSIPEVRDYLGSNSNQSECGTNYLFNRNYKNGCGDTTWMLINNSTWWLLGPDIFVNVNSPDVYAVYGEYGNIVNRSPDWVYDVYARPVVYLSSEVKITGGSGTLSNPFTLG